MNAAIWKFILDIGRTKILNIKKIICAIPPKEEKRSRRLKVFLI
jgi:hypothetical protein